MLLTPRPLMVLSDFLLKNMLQLKIPGFLAPLALTEGSKKNLSLAYSRGLLTSYNRRRLKL